MRVNRETGEFQPPGICFYYPISGEFQEFQPRGICSDWRGLGGEKTYDEAREWPGDMGGGEQKKSHVSAKNIIIEENLAYWRILPRDILRDHIGKIVVAIIVTTIAVGLYLDGILVF